MFALRKLSRLAARWGLLLTALAAAILAAPAAVRAQSSPPPDPAQVEPDCKPTVRRIFMPLVSNGTQISGKVTLKGQPAAGVYVALYNLKDPPELAGVAQTDAQGGYTFINPAPVPAGSQGYRVVYENGKNGNPVDTRALAWWEGPRIPSLSGGTLNGGRFDIGDLDLLKPESGAVLALPAVFTWTPRGISGDDYEFNLLDAAYNYVFWSDPRLGAAGSYTLTALPAGVTAGAKYWWIVWIYAPDGGRGAGRVMRAVSFGTAPAPSSMSLEIVAHTWPPAER